MSVIDEPIIDEGELVLGWSGVIAQLNTWSSDNRIIRELTWPDLPLTMGIAHFDDTAVGTIDHIEIRGDDVWAHGRFSDTEDGRASAAQLAEGVLRHVSIEPREGTAVTHDIYDDDGEWIGMAEEWMSLVVGAVAFARVPAFTEAVIAPDAEAAAFVNGEPSGGTADPPRKEGPLPDGPIGVPAEDPPDEDTEELVASVARLRTLADPDVVRAAGAGPVTRNAEHYTRPPAFTYDAQTRLTISPDGEICGHVLPAGARSRTTVDDDWVAGRNPNDDLSEWLVGATPLSDGSVVPTGVIVADGLHGPAHQAGASGDEVRRLIESTACQVGTVTAWWDDFGLAVHGSTSPGVSPEQASRAMAGCPSVDERLFDERGWMVTGVLCVNVCRFKPGEAMVRVASGKPVRRLVASAAPAPCGCGSSGGSCSCSGDHGAGPSSEPASKPPAPPGRLSALDKTMQRERLRAAVAGRR